jgi:hypothetical protein
LIEVFGIESIDESEERKEKCYKEEYEECESRVLEYPWEEEE